MSMNHTPKAAYSGLVEGPNSYMVSEAVVNLLGVALCLPVNTWCIQIIKVYFSPVPTHYKHKTTCCFSVTGHFENRRTCDKLIDQVKDQVLGQPWVRAQVRYTQACSWLSYQLGTVWMSEVFGDSTAAEITVVVNYSISPWPRRDSGHSAH